MRLMLPHASIGSLELLLSFLTGSIDRWFRPRLLWMVFLFFKCFLLALLKIWEMSQIKMHHGVLHLVHGCICLWGDARPLSMFGEVLRWAMVPINTMKSTRWALYDKLKTCCDGSWNIKYNLSYRNTSALCAASKHCNGALARAFWVCAVLNVSLGCKSNELDRLRGGVIRRFGGEGKAGRRKCCPYNCLLCSAASTVRSSSSMSVLTQQTWKYARVFWLSDCFFSLQKKKRKRKKPLHRYPV